MRRSLFQVMLCLFLFGANAAQADTSRTCILVETLAGLPGDLHDIRGGRGDVGEFRRDLAQTRIRLRDNRSAVLFSATELYAMQRYLNAVQRNWDAFGAEGDSRQTTKASIVPATLKQPIATIIKRFGCQYPKTNNPAPLKGFDAGSVNPFIVLAVLAAKLVFGFIVLKLMKYGQRDKRVICRVPAKLHLDGQSYPTQIMNISRGGVMVEAPGADMDKAAVTLGLPSVQIRSRVVWCNRNFAGLAFEKKVSMQLVEEISKIKPLPLNSLPPAKVAKATSAGLSSGQAT